MLENLSKLTFKIYLFNLLTDWSVGLTDFCLVLNFQRYNREVVHLDMIKHFKLVATVLMYLTITVV